MNLFFPGGGATDLGAGTVTFWGDGTRPAEVTTVEDTARTTARVALDPGVKGGKFAFAGDRISFQGAADVIGADTGRRLERRSLGSEVDLRRAKAEAEKDPSNPFGGVMLACLRHRLNGQAALSDIQDDRCPDVRLESLADSAARNLPVHA